MIFTRRPLFVVLSDAVRVSHGESLKKGVVGRGLTRIMG